MKTSSFLSIVCLTLLFSSTSTATEPVKPVRMGSGTMTFDTVLAGD